MVGHVGMSAIGPKQTISTKSSKAICPRCGYDLRGTIETWAKQCSLEGKCTECGLDFPWAELLSEKFSKPAWCFEYAKGLRQHFLTWVKTYIMCWWPWTFWSKLRMSHTPQWRRLVVFLLFQLALCYFVFLVSNGIRGYIIWHQVTTDLGFTTNVKNWSVAFQWAILPFSDTSLGMVNGSW